MADIQFPTGSTENCKNLSVSFSMSFCLTTCKNPNRSVEWIFVNTFTAKYTEKHLYHFLPLVPNTFIDILMLVYM